ncbi:MAG: 3-deoxy-D-manno-octulosonic acid transferase [Rickettsiales bacterium]
MLILYRIFSWLASLVVPIVLLLRVYRQKEDRQRLAERFGKTYLSRPDGAVVWIHAASMGESLSVLPVIQKLIADYPALHIVLTTVTLTSARTIAPKLPERTFHQFVPVDLPWAVSRFIRHWKPDLAIWVESEFWPNQMHAMHRTGKPMALINARISERSYHGWQRAPYAIRTLLSCFRIILAKSEEDVRRFKNLGAEYVSSVGNLKFSSPALDADPKVTSEILQVIGDRPVWMAASTHAGEEEIIGEVHRLLREKFPRILTLIVPRHNTRGNDIAAMLSDKKLRVSQRSKQEAIGEETDIYLADTMGELGIFYRIAEIVFIGGSLVPHGGQNPFEPARLDCAVLYGPHMENFAEFCAELEAVDGAVRVKDAADLAEKVESLLRDQEKQEKLANAALAVVKTKQDVLENVVQALEAYLPSKARA